MTNAITRDELLKIHDQTGKLAREVMTAKNHDYAHDNDVFRNFRRYGTLGVLVRLSDKLARLDSFEENKKFAVADEKLQDTIVDIINYAVIYLAMKQEDKNSNWLGTGLPKPPFGLKINDYDRDLVRQLEREIELEGNNKFVGTPIASGPYCNSCEQNLADSRKDNGAYLAPRYWCSNCAAEAGMDTSEMTLMVRL